MNKVSNFGFVSCNLRPLPIYMSSQSTVFIFTHFLINYNKSIYSGIDKSLCISVQARSRIEIGIPALLSFQIAAGIQSVPLLKSSNMWVVGCI